MSEDENKQEKPEYLYYYVPYSRRVMSAYPVIGETEKYWKILLRRIDNYYLLVDKKSLKEKGSSTQWYCWTKEQYRSFIHRKMLEKQFTEIKLGELTDKQLEQIIAIVNPKEDNDDKTT